MAAARLLQCARARFAAAGALVAALAGALACAPRVQPRPPPAPLAPPPQTAIVYFPAGDCSTGALELQVYDRGSNTWRAHPRTPFLPAGGCSREPTERLLNEIRVRCIDPTDRATPSRWVVGARRAAPSEPSHCRRLRRAER